MTIIQPVLPPSPSAHTEKSEAVQLTEARFSLAAIAAVAHGSAVSADDPTREQIAAAHRVVLNRISTGELAYGINTRLGAGRNHRVPDDLLRIYQEQIIFSHAAALGPPLSAPEVRATIFARMAGIARGGSGASLTLFDGLAALLNNNLTPLVPANGSVGAADLVQLAAIGNVLLGHGKILRADHTAQTACAAFAELGIEPIELQPKDALALIGTNSATLGIGTLLAFGIGHVLGNSDVVAALTVAALDANQGVFDARVVAARPLLGQIDSAAHIRAALLDPDEQHTAAPPSPSVQDPLSIRTIPQVHGAAVDQLRAVFRILEIELNSRAENPLVLVESGEIISNGNFSAIELALGFESVRLALAHVGMLIERRISTLAAMLRTFEQFYKQLSQRRWRNQYFVPVLLQNAAAACLTELKQLASPITIMGTPVSDGVEDHNSMAYSAISLTKTALALLRTLQAVEALLAAEVFRVKHPEPLKPTGAGTARLFEMVNRATATIPSGVLTEEIVTGVISELANNCFGVPYSADRPAADTLGGRH